jgi:NADH dehydrogenase FAD-containing subunit
MSRSRKHRIVILGGSFGGLTAAHTLRRLLPFAPYFTWKMRMGRV